MKIEVPSDHSENVKLMRQAVQDCSEFKSEVNNDKFFDSDEEDGRKDWKKSNLEMHNYG